MYIKIATFKNMAIYTVQVAIYTTNLNTVQVAIYTTNLNK